MKIAEVNMVDYGSTGNIMLQIADCAIDQGLGEIHAYKLIILRTYSLRATLTRRQSVSYRKDC